MFEISAQPWFDAKSAPPQLKQAVYSQTFDEVPCLDRDGYRFHGQFTISPKCACSQRKQVLSISERSNSCQSLNKAIWHDRDYMRCCTSVQTSSTFVLSDYCHF